MSKPVVVHMTMVAAATAAAVAAAVAANPVLPVSVEVVIGPLDIFSRWTESMLGLSEDDSLADEDIFGEVGQIVFTCCFVFVKPR